MTLILASQSASRKMMLEAAGVPLRYQTRHEIIDSIYFTDPNGYPLEISFQLRPMTAMDADDADRTMRAGMALEDALKAGDGAAFTSIDDVWKRKGAELEASLGVGVAA